MSHNSIVSSALSSAAVPPVVLRTARFPAWLEGLWTGKIEAAEGEELIVRVTDGREADDGGLPEQVRVPRPPNHAPVWEESGLEPGETIEGVFSQLPDGRVELRVMESMQPGREVVDWACAALSQRWRGEFGPLEISEFPIGEDFGWTTSVQVDGHLFWLVVSYGGLIEPPNHLAPGDLSTSHEAARPAEWIVAFAPRRGCLSLLGLGTRPDRALTERLHDLIWQRGNEAADIDASRR